MFQMRTVKPSGVRSQGLPEPVPDADGSFPSNGGVPSSKLRHVLNPPKPGRYETKPASDAHRSFPSNGRAPSGKLGRVSNAPKPGRHETKRVHALSSRLMRQRRNALMMVIPIMMLCCRTVDSASEAKRSAEAVLTKAQALLPPITLRLQDQNAVSRWSGGTRTLRITGFELHEGWWYLRVNRSKPGSSKGTECLLKDIEDDPKIVKKSGWSISFLEKKNGKFAMPSDPHIFKTIPDDIPELERCGWLNGANALAALKDKAAISKWYYHSTVCPFRNCGERFIPSVCFHSRPEMECPRCSQRYCRFCDSTNLIKLDPKDSKFLYSCKCMH